VEVRALSIPPDKGETPIKFASERSDDRTREARESVTSVPSLKRVLKEDVKEEVTDEPQPSLPVEFAEVAVDGVKGVKTIVDETLRLKALGGASSVPLRVIRGDLPIPKPSMPPNRETALDDSASDALGDLGLPDPTRNSGSPAVALLIVLTSSPRRSPAEFVPSTCSSDSSRDAVVTVGVIEIGNLPGPGREASDRFFDTVRSERRSRGVSRRRTSTLHTGSANVTADAGLADSSDVLGSSVTFDASLGGAFDVAVSSMK
jgi:hypothetical protein